LRIKEQETRLTLQEHDDDDEVNIYVATKETPLPQKGGGCHFCEFNV